MTFYSIEKPSEMCRIFESKDISSFCNGVSFYQHTFGTFDNVFTYKSYWTHPFPDGLSHRDSSGLYKVFRHTP